MKKLFLFLMLCTTVYAMDFPPLPTGYWGYVSQDGQMLGNAEVLVKSGDEIVGSMVRGTSADGLYALQAEWDNPDTAIKEGVQVGDTLSFYVNGKLIKSTSIGQQGSNIRLDLDIVSDAPSAPQKPSVIKNPIAQTNDAGTNKDTFSEDNVKTSDADDGSVVSSEDDSTVSAQEHIQNTDNPDYTISKNEVFDFNKQNSSSPYILAGIVGALVLFAVIFLIKKGVLK